jgi:hypothetical protein
LPLRRILRGIHEFLGEFHRVSDLQSVIRQNPACRIYVE